MDCNITKKRRIFSLTLLMSLLSLSGCSEDPVIHSEGFFEYIILKPGRYWYDGENESIAIVGFTESGLNQQSIRIPDRINDIPVEYLGYEGTNGAHAKAYIYFPKISGNVNLKNIYFFDNIRDFVTIWYNWESNDSSSQLNVFNCSKNRLVGPIVQTFNYYWYNLDNYNSYCRYSLPNVIYSYNMESENYYSLDIVQNGEILVEPAKPNCNGYNFTGWFLDPECINEYNFQNAISLENNDRLFLHAGWEKNI
ncbi:MAG: InlB B-repeat-containing protein [Bacilli bacterium]|nr:InlB B-repeat-containing protein [Bacilli bacterium]